MIAQSGSIDEAQVKALKSLLTKANGEDEAEEKEKLEAEIEAEDKEIKKKQQAVKEKNSESSSSLPVQDIETIAKSVASEFGKIFLET